VRIQLPAPGVFFVMSNGQTPCDTLVQAFARYDALTFPHPADLTIDTAGVVTSCVLTVDSQDESHPDLGTDESYTLDIPSSPSSSSPLLCSIRSSTIYGAMRALESFSQLVEFDFETRAYGVAHAPWFISDKPRFPHRGLMVDTARHFQPVSSLLQIVDSLPFAKLNVLHWHMVDTQVPETALQCVSC
jgi:hexosaminidase